MYGVQKENSVENNKEEIKGTEYYRDAYLREKKRGEELTSKLSYTEIRDKQLTDRLDKIKTSIIWKAAAPIRGSYHFVVRNMQRLGYYGSVKGIMRKLNSKSIERKARLQHGTASFPDATERSKESSEEFSRHIKFSIIVPLYNTPEKFLREMIDSVCAQTYGNWQLCLGDGSDAEHGYVEEICRGYAEKDSRVCYRRLEKNEGISGNTNQCLKFADGDYIGLLDHDDVLHPCALYLYMHEICDNDADYIYSDETTFKGNSINNMITLHFKPDYAIDDLRANNYICHFSVFARELLDGTELFRPQFDGSQDHDMILRLTSRAKHIVHVPKILYYWRSHNGSTAKNINTKSYAIDAAKGAVTDHLTKSGFNNFEITSTRAFETIFRIKYEINGDPLVSIIIPAKDNVFDTKRCISSIFQKSTYDNYEIILMDNGSAQPETEAYENEISKDHRVKVVHDDGSFNYSRINNEAVKQSRGKYIVLLNNDTEVITLDWIEELLMYAQRSDVGAVGAKLYYPDKTIQHAGIVIGLGAHRTAGHTHYKVASNNLGYMGRLCYTQDVSAVTGACLMVKRSDWDDVGGLDESFEVSLNDVDFCLKLRAKGLLNVFTPFAELYHYESASRGSDLVGERAERYNRESAHFRDKWKEVIDKGDPYYNPNFSLDRSDFTLRSKGDPD